MNCSYYSSISQATEKKCLMIIFFQLLLKEIQPHVVANFVGLLHKNVSI